jgi:hypothetical protein
MPGTPDPRQTKAALRGLDGGQQLRAALDEARRCAPAVDVMVVNNGGRGPMIIDTRARQAGDWVMDGLIPTGVIAALSDLDDPSPQTLLENGFDAVVLLEMRGAAVPGVPVRLRVYFHPRLGLESPAPFWIKFDPARPGFVLADEPGAA